MAPGPLGLRLVYIKPVLDAVSGHRVGVIAAERVISSPRGIRVGTPEEGVLSLPTLVPVTVRPHDISTPTEQGFIVQSPLGQPLLVAHVTPKAIRVTRTAWRENTSAVVLAILALTLVVSMPPLMRRRTSFQTMAGHLQASGLVLAMLITPAATARLWTERLWVMMALSALFGALGGAIGLLISYHTDLAAGGTIVLIVTAWFGLSLLIAPRHGLLARLRHGEGLLPRSRRAETET